MKKFLSLLLCIIIVFGLVACKNDKENEHNNIDVNIEETLGTSNETGNNGNTDETTNNDEDNTSPNEIKYNGDKLQVVLDTGYYNDFNGKIRDLLDIGELANIVILDGAIAYSSSYLTTSGIGLDWTRINVGAFDNLLCIYGKKYIVTETNGRLTAHQFEQDSSTQKISIDSVDIGCTVDEFSSIFKMNKGLAVLFQRDGKSYFQEVSFDEKELGEPIPVYCNINGEEFDVTYIEFVASKIKFYVIVNGAHYETSLSYDIEENKVVFEAVEKTKMVGVDKYLFSQDTTYKFYVSQNDKSSLYSFMPSALLATLDYNNWISQCGKWTLSNGYTTDDIVNVNTSGENIIFKMKDGAHFLINSNDVLENKSGELIRFDEYDEVAKLGNIIQIVGGLYLMDDGYFYKYIK